MDDLTADELARRQRVKEGIESALGIKDLSETQVEWGDPEPVKPPPDPS